MGRLETSTQKSILLALAAEFCVGPLLLYGRQSSGSPAPVCLAPPSASPCCTWSSATPWWSCSTRSTARKQRAGLATPSRPPSGCFWQLDLFGPLTPPERITSQLLFYFFWLTCSSGPWAGRDLPTSGLHGRSFSGGRATPPVPLPPLTLFFHLKLLHSVPQKSVSVRCISVHKIGTWTLVLSGMTITHTGGK